jgi:hypothetical protein
MMSKADTPVVINRLTYQETRRWPTSSIGGCNFWRSFLTNQIASASLNFLPSSVTYTYVNSYEMGVVDRTFTCSNILKARGIISVLTSLSPSISNNSFSCDGNIWTVNFCSGVAGICVNCNDPCGLVGDLPSLSPCQTPLAYSETGFVLFSVGFIQPPGAPKVIQTKVDATSNSVSIQTELSVDGIVYYALFARTKYSYPTPRSTAEVILQNRVFTSVNNRTTLSLDNLPAAFDYVLYTFTQSFLGRSMSLQNLIATRVNVSTLCCRKVFFQLSTQNIFEGKDYLNFLTITSTTPATSPLFAFVNLFEIDSNNQNFLPSQSQAQFVPTSVNLQGTTRVQISLSKMLPGQFAVSLSLDGDEALKYIVQGQGTKYDASAADDALSLIVISTQDPLPAPVVETVKMSNDGSSIQIQFDSNTNQAGLLTVFLCDTLFGFACAESSRCVWVDSKTVTAFLSSHNSCAGPQNLFEIKGGKGLRARCPSANGACTNFNSWAQTSTNIMTILPPDSPITPSVSISMPATIGQCSNLLLDISSSSGNGGRQWANLTILVQSSANVTELQKFLNNRYQISPPTMLPARFFDAGQSYNFIVELCNFLGQCSTSSKKVTILATIMPTISIAGANLRSLKRFESLSLKASAEVSSCDGSSSSSTGISFSWNIYEGTTLKQLQSTSKDPSRLVLPAFSMQTNSIYRVEAIATYLEQSSHVSTQISVVSGNIVPVVLGGLQQAMRVESSMMLDASGSFDQDKANVFGKNAGLVYSWSCTQVEPSLYPDCENIFDQTAYLNQELASSSINLQALSTASDFVAQILLTIQDESGSRSSSATIQIRILPALAATLSLQSSATVQKMNAGQSLQLVGDVFLPVSLAANMSWSLEGNVDFNLSSIALTPLTTKLSPVRTAAVSQTVILKLAPNTLVGGLTYRFQLVCQLQSPGRPTSLSIEIAVNSPPLPGKFLVSPENGIELVDPFTFACSQWQDSDLPLQYQFSYITSAGNQLIIRSLAESTFTSVALPAGSESNNNVVCITGVYDSYMANSTAYASVVVTKSPALNQVAINSFLSQTASILLTSTNVDELKQATGLSSYLLNQVNCSLAPDCAALNRKACYRTTHTCGPCLSPSAIGTDGDSNDRCFDFNDVSSPVSDQLKECPVACSGHGTCRFLSRLDASIVEKCYASQLDCYAKCDCDEGYTLSSSCSTSDEELQAKMAQRQNLLSGVEGMMKLEDVSTESVSSWISNLKEISQVYDELSFSAAMTIVNLSQTITSTVKYNEISPESTDGLLQTLNAATMTVEKEEIHRRRKRRKLLQILNSTISPIDPEIVDAMKGIQTSVESYSRLLSEAMVVGQFPRVQVTSNIKSHIEAIRVPKSSQNDFNENYECSANADIAIPRSPLEKALNIPSGSFNLPLCNRNALGNDGSVAKEALNVAAVAISSKMYEDFFDSNPLSLHLSAFPCSSSDCQMELVLPRNTRNSTSSDDSFSDGSVINVDSDGKPVTFRTECAANDWSVHDFTCPDGFTYQTACNGSAAMIESKCPTEKRPKIPNCNFLNSDTLQTAGSKYCSMKVYTAHTITCSCKLYVPTVVENDNLEQRKLMINSKGELANASTAIPSGAITVNYVSMLESVAGNFESTVLTAGSLNAATIARGWQAMVVVGSLIGFIVVAVIYSHYADMKVKQAAAKDENIAGKKSELMRSLSTKVQVQKRKSITAFVASGGNKNRNGTSKGGILQLAEEALPQILSSRSIMTKISNEIKRHHRWFGVVFYYSHKFPRVLRVVSLSTNIIAMLFIQSVTYSLTHSDDGSCATYTDQTACLEPQSSFSTGSSKCYWTGTAKHGQCKFIEPENSMEVVIFVAIFSALVSTPISLVADRIITTVLAVPTVRHYVAKASKVLDEGWVNSSVAIIPRASNGRLIKLGSRAKTETSCLKLAENQLTQLIKGLKDYRETLKDQHQLREFDGKSTLPLLSELCFNIGHVHQLLISAILCDEFDPNFTICIKTSPI